MTLIKNYLENVVREVIERRADCAGLETDALEDLMCLALNQLPTRYYRDEDKMERFLAQDERQEMEMSAEAAVEGAMDYLRYVEVTHSGQGNSAG